MAHQQAMVVAGWAGALTLCASAWATDHAVTLESDNRSILGFTMVQQCPNQGGVTLSEQAKAFAPFSRTVDAGQECDHASAIATAGQNSHVSPTFMSAFGNALGAGSSELFGVIHAIPRSRFEVAFQLTEPRLFSLDATLLAVGDHGGSVISAYASFQLREAGGATIFEHIRTTQTPGMVELDPTFMLEPGVYTVRAEASVVIDGLVPPAVSSGAAFWLDIDITPVPPLGDLNHDGLVDVGDLLILLGAWGECPSDVACEADLNGDGAVDVSDMLLLLANWS